MCSSTTAERQSLASRDRTCCLRRCLPARPLRFYGFRGPMAHPTQSLCPLRTRRRRRPRNTRYRAPATAYPDRSLTGRTTPAFLAHKQSILPLRPYGLLRFARNDGRQLPHATQLASEGAAAVAEEVERLRRADIWCARWQRGDRRRDRDRCRHRRQRRRAAPQFVNRRRDRLGSFAGLKQRAEDRLARRSEEHTSEL